MSNKNNGDEVATGSVRAPLPIPTVCGVATAAPGSAAASLEEPPPWEFDDEEENDEDETLALPV